MKDKIVEMFALQQKLNDESNGIGWEEGFTNKGKKIDWNLCIVQETSELLNSFPWKHWKSIDKEPDWNNAKIELVDIWHFIMSEYISLEQVEFFDYVVDVFETPADKNQDDVNQHIVDLSQNLMYDALTRNIDGCLEQFTELCFYCDLSFDELYKLYIGKNSLNKFRQDNGYKEGTYIKIWNGKEDNVVMQEILESNDSITYDELLAKLNIQYSFAKGA